MNYVKNEFDNIKPMSVLYALWPNNATECSEVTLNFLELFAFNEYKDAEEAATVLLRWPNEVICDYMANSDDQETIINDFKNIHTIYVNQMLSINDADGNCINCPENYIYNVGYVCKLEEMNTAEA